MTRADLVYKMDAIVEVTKEFSFEACHHLLGYVGKCENPHGHSYKCQVTLVGTLNEIGMVCDFKDIKKAINEKILNEEGTDLDHADLNKIFRFNTTAENMCVWIYDNIKEYLLNSETLRYDVKVCEVKLWETATSYASYKGERGGI